MYPQVLYHPRMTFDSTKIWSGWIAVTVYMEVILHRTTLFYEKRAVLGTLVFSGFHSVLSVSIPPSHHGGMAPGGVWYDAVRTLTHGRVIQILIVAI